MTYRPEIDGLRAIAVIPVVFFHAGFSTFEGGFVGVDIFFVISGFLITNILLMEMETKTFSFISFYERRARRILPALYFVIFACMPFAWLLLWPTDMVDFSQSMVAVPTFWSNILFWQEASYWDTAGELKPLLHTWSLAVEEQYYILFPIFLVLVWSIRKRWVFFLIVFGALISLAVAHWGAFRSPAATFYLLPTRCWELSLGAGLSCFLLYRKKLVRRVFLRRLTNEVLGFLGLVLITYAIVFFNEGTPFPSLFTLVPTIGAACIILSSTKQTVIGKILAVKPLVMVGLMSYSIYLWHQPIFAFTRHIVFPELSSRLYLMLIVGITLLAYLTWKFIEVPFRNKTKINRKTLCGFAAAISFFFVAFGLIGVTSDGFKQRQWYLQMLHKSYQPDNTVLKFESWRMLQETKSKSASLTKQETAFGVGAGDVNLLLLGNSHSKDLFNVLTSSDTAISRFQINRYESQIAGLVNKKNQLYTSNLYINADVVMIASRYSEADVDALEKLVATLISDKKRVVLVKNIYEFEFSGGDTTADNILQRGILKKLKTKEMKISDAVTYIDRAYFDQRESKERCINCKKSDAAIKLISKKYDGVTVLDRMEYACERMDRLCFSINENLEKYYYDYGHHTAKGALFFGLRVDQIDWLKGL